MQGAQFCNSDKSLLEIRIFTLKNHFQFALQMFHETAKICHKISLPQQQNTRAIVNQDPPEPTSPPWFTLMQTLPYWALSDSDTSGF
jgi:hypothetical protein